MGFKIGQKVVCIDDKFDMLQPQFTLLFKELPVEDETYTVREYGDGRILLDEIVNPTLDQNVGGKIVPIESGFASRRFAPLLDDRADFADSILQGIAEDIEVERLINPDWYEPMPEEEVLEEEGLKPLTMRKGLHL